MLLKSSFVTTLGSECPRSKARVFLGGDGPTFSEAPTPKAAAARLSASPLQVLGGGVAFIALVILLGFVIPGTLCGMGVARAFDAPLNLKSALVCGGIASTFWFVFAQLLGVGLGPALPWWV
jgi:hypothetical protein